MSKYYTIYVYADGSDTSGYIVKNFAYNRYELDEEAEPETVANDEVYHFDDWEEAYDIAQYELTALHEKLGYAKSYIYDDKGETIHAFEIVNYINDL